MPKDTKTLGNNKARAWESLGFAHKKRLCQHFDTTSFLFPHLFLFQGKSQHHTIVAVCQRTDCFKGAIVALAGNQGNQL